MTLQQARSAAKRGTIVAVIGALVALLAPSGPAVAHPTIPAPVFDPQTVSWASVRDMTGAKFSNYFQKRVDQGYMVTDLEVDVIGGEYRVGAVFQFNTDGRGWRSLRNLTSDGFHNEWLKARDEGMRLVDQETYVHNGKRLWAGVFVQNREGYDWASYRNVSSTEFSERFKNYRDDGFMPLDIEAYKVGNKMRYAAVWVNSSLNPDWKLWRNLTSAQFQGKFAQYKSRFRMIDVESYQTPSGQRNAGIWIGNTDGRKWIELRNLTAKGFANRWNRYLDEGYRLIDFEKYSTSSGARYAGIWRQNSDRPDWELRKAVNARITDEKESFDVPGMAVVIARNGEILYRRGFGHANVEGNTWMDSRHVQRLASVAKAVAGVMTMRMVQDGEVSLSVPTASLIPEIPSHHTHTIGQLVSNRGCVRHYPDGDDSFASETYTTALSAAKEFWDDPLVCTPNQYYYSTHGYTILCAALEQVSGVAVGQLMKQKLMDPFSLGTLAPETSTAKARTAKLYTFSDGKNEEVSRDEVSWKTCGGGMWSSALDLTQFGIKLVDGEILNASNLQLMWTPPNGASNYAYGWNTEQEAGRSVASRTGSWRGARSYLRIYQDDELVISVLTNRKNGGHSAIKVGKDIGTLLLDWIDGNP